MTDSKLKARVMYYCSRVGLSQWSDDIFQEIKIKWLSGLSQNQTVDQTIQDVCRDWYGRFYERRVMMAEDQKNPDLPISLARVEDKSEKVHNIKDVLKLVDNIDNRFHRAVVVFHYLLEVEQKDIAFAFSVTHSRISQVLKHALKSLNKKIKNKEIKKLGPNRVNLDVDLD